MDNLQTTICSEGLRVFKVIFFSSLKLIVFVCVCERERLAIFTVPSWLNNRFLFFKRTIERQIPNGYECARSHIKMQLGKYVLFLHLYSQREKKVCIIWGQHFRLADWERKMKKLNVFHLWLSVLPSEVFPEWREGTWKRYLSMTVELELVKATKYCCQNPFCSVKQL